MMKRRLMIAFFVIFFAVLAVPSANVFATENDGKPDTPVLTLNYSKDKGHIVLSWNQVDCDGYYLYRKEEEGKYELYDYLSYEDTTYTDAVKNGKQYKYKLTAYNYIDNEDVFGETSNVVTGYRYCANEYFALDQRKDAPNGCELYALSILLHYNGVDIDPLTICKDVPKENSPYYNGEKKVGGNPNRAFLGDPTKESGWGIWKNGIVSLSKKYKKGIVDISGSSLDEVLEVVKEGHVVQVWITIGNRDYQYISASWTDYKTGEKLDWKHDNHSLVIIGYNEHNIIVSDPLKGGIVAYDRTVFEKNFNWHGKSALYYK